MGLQKRREHRQADLQDRLPFKKISSFMPVSKGIFQHESLPNILQGSCKWNWSGKLDGGGSIIFPSECESLISGTTTTGPNTIPTTTSTTQTVTAPASCAALEEQDHWSCSMESNLNKQKCSFDCESRGKFRKYTAECKCKNVSSWKLHVTIVITYKLYLNCQTCIDCHSNFQFRENVHGRERRVCKNARIYLLPTTRQMLALQRRPQI